MDYEISKFVDTKTIIVNLLKEDEKNYLTVKRLQSLMEYIYMELREQCQLDQYQISFDINFDAIERTVIYNNNIFGLDIDGEIIYLRESKSADELAQQYKADNTILNIIKNFKNAVAV